MTARAVMMAVRAVMIARKRQTQARRHAEIQAAVRISQLEHVAKSHRQENEEISRRAEVAETRIAQLDILNLELQTQAARATQRDCPADRYDVCYGNAAFPYGYQQQCAVYHSIATTSEDDALQLANRVSAIEKNLVEHGGYCGGRAWHSDSSGSEPWQSSSAHATVQPRKARPRRRARNASRQRVSQPRTGARATPLLSTGHTQTGTPTRVAKGGVVINDDGYGDIEIRANASGGHEAQGIAAGEV